MEDRRDSPEHQRKTSQGQKEADLYRQGAEFLLTMQSDLKYCQQGRDEDSAVDFTENAPPTLRMVRSIFVVLPFISIKSSLEKKAYCHTIWL